MGRTGGTVDVIWHSVVEGGMKATVDVAWLCEAYQTEETRSSIICYENAKRTEVKVNGVYDNIFSNRIVCFAA